MSSLVNTETPFTDKVKELIIQKGNYKSIYNINKITKFLIYKVLR